jgi:hypothetical protein
MYRGQGKEKAIGRGVKRG